ncbi:MAG: chlorite dismutase family protein [Armatimonadota bacterium]|nr:chlorite dismutase family protein [Armatimonadota bacterium]
MAEAKVHGFLFLRVPAGLRNPQGAKRTKEAVEAAERTEGVLAIYPYSLVGLRADADLGFWIAATDLEKYQSAAREILHTGLEVTCTLWGFVRPSQYTGRSGTSVQVPGKRLRYLIVYPFSKTHAWYQLPEEERRNMMREHARVGHGFKGIEQLLLYSTGLADWEFVVGYETDDPERFSELVMALRSTAARPYTLRDTPIFTARSGSLEEILEEVFGTGIKAEVGT